MLVGGAVLVGVSVDVTVGVAVATGEQKHSVGPVVHTNPVGHTPGPQAGKSPQVCRHRHGLPAAPAHTEPGRQLPEQ